MTEPDCVGNDLTPEAMIERARAMIPVLRQRANDCEALRRVPDETVRDFLEAGFFRIIQPKRFGGYEFDLPTLVRCMIEISRGCGSSGWVLSLTSAHTWWAAQYEPEAQEELFADGGDLRFPLIFAPTGTATLVDGGYDLNGVWNYASGCDLSNWLAVNAIVPDPDGGKEPLDLVVCILRQDDFEIVDNWYVMGLRGTGSKQAVIKSLRIPKRRALSLNALDKGPAPGLVLHDNPFYGGPASPIFFAEIAAVAVGIAKGAIDVFEERARTKSSAFRPGEKLFENAAIRRRLAQSTAELDAAEAMLLGEANAYMLLVRQRVPNGQSGTIDERARMQLQLQHAVEMSANVVDTLFVAGGSSALNEGEPMQRCFRDISALRTHYLMDGDRLRENWGRMAFGLDPLHRTPGL